MKIEMELKDLLIAALALGLLLGFFEGVDFGARMRGLSDALWWQFAPWVLIAIFWGVLLIQLRRHVTRSND